MNPQTPPRSSLLRDALAALAESPDPGAVARLEIAEARNRERQQRQFDALMRSPGGRGEEAGAVDLVSMYEGTGRQFVPGPGVQGRGLEMLGGTRSVSAAERMQAQAGSVQVPASVSLAIGGSGSRGRSYSRRKSYGRSYSRSRSRSGGRVSYYQKRAIARRAYIRGKYPSAVYAHPYVPRSSDASRAMGITPGKTFQEVSPEEQARRRSVGWYGKGDYMQGDYGVPQFTGKTLTGTRINLGKNVEMIRQEVFFNVISPAAGQQQIQQFEINIGLDEMFPLGSQFANNYKKYRITQLAFTYKNMLPQSQTTNQVGQVSLTFNPDVGEENDITTNMQVANDQSTVSCNANDDVTLFCEMDPSRGAPNQFLNIRNKKLRVTQDPSDFDAGVFILTLAGFPTVAGQPYQIGRISVSYCCELQHEVVSTSMGNAIDTDYFLRPCLDPLGGVTTKALVWDTSTMLQSENNVGCLLFNQSSYTNPTLSVQWPATAFGYYELQLAFESAPIAVAVTPADLVYSNPFTLNSANFTVGPVFDMLNTSLGTAYSTAWTNQCLAPNGSAIVAPGDPYCYGNATMSWDPVNAAGVVPIGSVFRIVATYHVYVPGVSSNSTLPILPAASNSPIQVQIGIRSNSFAAGASMAANSAVYASRWSLRVTEYNATMRLKLNGTQDQPYTTDFAGVPKLLTTATW